MDYNFAALLLVGFLGGGHCVGMCGGIVTALSLQPRSRTPSFGRLLTYNLGRIGSYTLIGGLVGAVGGLGLASLNIDAVQQGVYLLANGLLIAMGLYLMGLSRFISHIERLGKPLWRWIQPWMQTLLPVRSGPQALLVGALWGWLPCGLVYSATLSALAAGSALGGAGMMLAFGLGTLPNLLAMGAFAETLRHWTQKPWVRQIAGLSIVGLAVGRLVAWWLH